VSPATVVSLGPQFISNADVSFTIATAARSFASFTVQRRIANGAYNGPNPGSLLPGTLIYQDTGSFYADTSYTYTLATTNKTGSSTLSQTSSVLSPTAVFGDSNFAYVSPIGPNLSFTLTSNKQYWYVRVKRYLNGSLLGQEVQLPSGQATYTYNDPSNGTIYADYSYNYVITPHNALGDPGTPYTTPTVSPDAAVSISSSTQTTSSVTLNFVYGTSYEYVSVAEVSNNNVGPYQTLANFKSSYTDTNLLANTSYTFKVRPYNALDVYVPGNEITSSAYSPYPTLSVPTATTNSTTSITIPLPGPVNYSYVSISRTTTVGGSPSTLLLTSSYTGTLFNDTNTNSIAASYTYTITPYNILNVANPAYTASPIVTAPVSGASASGNSVATVTTTGTPTVTSSGISFNVTGYGTTFSTVNIIRNTTYLGVTSQYTVASYAAITNNTFKDNFTPRADSSYYYTIVPLSGTNSPGTSVNTIAVTATATVSVSSLTFTKTTLSFNFNDLTTFYDVSMALVTNGITGTYFVYYPNGNAAYSDTSSNYGPGSSYKFAITPRNAAGVLGTQIFTNTTQGSNNAKRIINLMTIIDNTTSAMVMYYPFDYQPDVIAPSYLPKFQSVIDSVGMVFYYGFDF